MDLLQNVSDDQTALVGCFVALIVSGLLMSLSYYVGQWNKSEAPTAHRLPMSEKVELRENKAA